MDPASTASSAENSEQAIELLSQIARLLDTGLDKESVRLLAGMCETGVNPEALATVVKELRREAAAIRGAEVAGARPVAQQRQ